MVWMSLSSLMRQAASVTGRHIAACPPARATPVVGESPLHELLVQDLLASLPAELAARLRSAPGLQAAQDWIAVATLYSWVAKDPPVAQRFLNEVAANPKQAGLALATALSTRLGPPARDAVWHWWDRVGVALQLLVAGVLLLMRAALFAWLAGLALGTPLDLAPSALGRGLLGQGLPPAEGPWGLLTLVVLAGAALWLALEATAGPVLMEEFRRLPAQEHHLPPPVAWRAEAWNYAWFLQASGLSAWIWGRWCTQLAARALEGGLSTGDWLVALPSTLCFPAACWGLVAYVRTVWQRRDAG